jgi:hypothetical protein
MNVKPNPAPMSRAIRLVAGAISSIPRHRRRVDTCLYLFSLNYSLTARRNILFPKSTAKPAYVMKPSVIQTTRGSRPKVLHKHRFHVGPPSLSAYHSQTPSKSFPRALAAHLWASTQTYVRHNSRRPGGLRCRLIRSWHRFVSFVHSRKLRSSLDE